MFRLPSRRAAVPLFVLSVTLLGTSGIAAGPLLIDDFGKGLSGGWEKKVFKGETVYRPILEEDYRRAFGEDPPRIGAVAIMTDTDNTGEEAVAWYGAIRFLPPSL